MSKFCVKCGEALVNDASFCARCGSQIEQPAQPTKQTYAQAPPQHQDQVQNDGSNQKNYTNLGGWLLFFVIINIFVALAAMGTIGSEFQTSMSTLSFVYDDMKTGLIVNIIGQVIAIAAIIFVILFIVQIFQRKSLFLRFMQIAKILSIISNIFVIIACGIIGIENFDSNVMSNLVGSMGGDVIGLFVMTLYFCKSIRVRTYMHNDEYMEKAIFAYKQPPLN